MTTILTIAGWMVVTVLGVTYFVGPLIVWRTTWHPAQYQLAHGSPGVTPLERTLFHEQRTRELELLGFERLISGGVPGPVQARATFFHLPGDGAIAYIASIQAGAMCAEYVEFARYYSDDRLLVINNARPIMGLPRFPPRYVVRLPSLTDTTDLFAAFRCIDNHGRRIGLQTGILPPDQIMPTVDRGLEAESSYVAERGYYSRPDSNGRRRITLKGAYLLSWRQCPPIKQWIDFSTRRAGLALLGRARESHQTSR